MERLLIVDDSVLDFIGELYVHEPEPVKGRVAFGDYLTISLHGFPEGSERRGDFAAPFHAHQCHCGKWVTCETPALSVDACVEEPLCKYHRPLGSGPLLLVERA